jgi:FkbM family methyltransferase
VKILSYAQNHEDVLLDRAFPRGKPGFYIDIGANDPTVASVTRHFYDLGWRGVNVEPALHPYGLLCEARDRDVNLNVALSDMEGDLALFELPGRLSSGSTFSEHNAARHRDSGLPFEERKVPTMTLAQVCEQHVGDTTIDFLSVDVEGHELQVLQGGDWARWRPRVVLVEATEPNTMIPTHEKWEHILLGADYRFAIFDGLNRWYVRSEDADLVPVLSVPPNIFDDYVPYAHFKHVQELQCAAENFQAAFEVSEKQEKAARVIVQTLKAEFHGFASELGMLRARYERLERSLTTTRAACEAIREQLAASQAASDELIAQLDAVRNGVVIEGRPSPDVLEGISPASLGVARRLTALSSRHPKTASSVKNALRAGLSVKRRLLG